MKLEAGIEIIAGYAKILPQSPGVYQMLDENEKILYIGKAKNLKNRVTSYTQANRLNNRLQRMVSETKKMVFVNTHTELEALLLEGNLINKLKPKYNILIYDEQKSLFIGVSKNHQFPRVFKYRGIPTKSSKSNNKFFGPQTSSAHVENTIVILQKMFLLRNCKDNFFANRTSPCLQYHIKRCSAPCVGRISADDYIYMIQQAYDFLDGKTTSLQENLASEMQKASDELEYERAAFYRDRLKILSQVQSHQKINTFKVVDADVVAVVELGHMHSIQLFSFRKSRQIGHHIYYARNDNGDKNLVMSAFLSQYYTIQPPPKEIILNIECDNHELLEKALSEIAKHKVEITIPMRGAKLELVEYAEHNGLQALKRYSNSADANELVLQDVARIFKLQAVPKRIEVYDNSHTSGQNAYGAMIVATPAGFNKAAYKRFAFSKIEAGGGDDYAMMRQMIRRRFDGNFGDFPDLMIIDGGKGQLSVVLRALEELGIDVPVVAMAKGKERNKGGEKFWLDLSNFMTLPPNSEVLYYLERLRDEAHRFGITTHRAKNTKQMRHSSIYEIEGIGKKRATALLAHFGSLAGIIGAGVRDLQRIKGISKAIAQKIYEHFHVAK